MRHLNNGTDHRHSKSCCDQSSPARWTTIDNQSAVVWIMSWSQTDNAKSSKTVMTKTNNALMRHYVTMTLWSGELVEKGPFLQINVSITIHLRWNFRFAHILISIKRSLQNFAHDTTAVVACAEFCKDMTTKHGNTAKRIFPRISNAIEMSLEKRTTYDHVIYIIPLEQCLRWNISLSDADLLYEDDTMYVYEYVL